MSQRVVNLPLYPLGDFEYRVRLQAVDVTLRFYLNTRQNLYHMEIYDSEKSPLYLGLPLVPETVLMDEPVLEPQGLTGYFFLYPFGEKSDGALPPDMTTLNQYFGLVYIFEE